MKWFKFNWIWGVGIGAVVLILLLLDFNPLALKRVSKWFSNHASSYPGVEKVTAAELSGRLDKALLYANEIGERLKDYRAQFDCENGLLLDQLFFGGELSNHYLRPTWFELKRDLPELVKKHEALISLLQKARSSVSRAENIEQWQDLPEDAEQASKDLDTAIRDRNRRVAQFGVLANQIRLQMAIQQRRNKR